MDYLFHHAEKVSDSLRRVFIRVISSGISMFGICFVLSSGIAYADADDFAVPKNGKAEAIRIARQFDTIFTMREANILGKRTGVIDRIIKGNVDATKLAFAQKSFEGAAGPKRIIVFMKFGHTWIAISTIDAFGKVAVSYDKENRREIAAKLDDLVFELDKSPHGVAARHKRDRANRPADDLPATNGSPNPALDYENGPDAKPTPRRPPEGRPPQKAGSALR